MDGAPSSAERFASELAVLTGRYLGEIGYLSTFDALIGTALGLTQASDVPLDNALARIAQSVRGIAHGNRTRG